MIFTVVMETGIQVIFCRFRSMTWNPFTISQTTLLHILNRYH